MRGRFPCRCGLALLMVVVVSARLQAADGPAGGSYATLGLTASEPQTGGPLGGNGLLLRELFRQAVLVAARDELGLSTRDMALGESLGEADSDGVLVVEEQTTGAYRKSLGLRLNRRGDEKPAAAVYEVELPWFGEKRGQLDYPAVVEALEPLSRKEIVAALQKVGAKGGGAKPRGTAAVGADIELALGEMNLFSQFAAVRALHDLERIDGQSPQTLAALVRGYANLGQLTAFAWNAAPKVFKARALIYAERLVNANEHDSWSLNHRGYARALAGLHAAALADFQAGEDAGARKTRSSSPGSRW